MDVRAAVAGAAGKPLEVTTVQLEGPREGEVRRAASDLQIPHPGLGTGAFVTVSIGTCVATPAENITDTIERADKLMYAAKKGGRNRVWA